MGITSVLIIDGLTGCLYKHLLWGTQLPDRCIPLLLLFMYDMEAHVDRGQALR